MLNGDHVPPSLHGHYPASSLLRSSPPLSGTSVLSASQLEAAGLFPGARFLAMLAPHKLAVRAFDHAAPLYAKEASMSETNLANATRLSAELSVSVAACAVLAAAPGLELQPRVGLS
jgi:hypothetical protein